MLPLNSGILAQVLVSFFNGDPRNSNTIYLIQKHSGPSNSWTIHGLWPDHCDGTYDSTCDSSRQYTGIGTILTGLGKSSLLSYMNTYWKDISGDDESFWEHEWGKHGTCVSTLAPACYTGYTSKQEVGDYFQKAVDIFKTRDTYAVSQNPLRTKHD